MHNICQNPQHANSEEKKEEKKPDCMKKHMTPTGNQHYTPIEIAMGQNCIPQTCYSLQLKQCCCCCCFSPLKKKWGKKKKKKKKSLIIAKHVH